MRTFPQGAHSLDAETAPMLGWGKKRGEGKRGGSAETLCTSKKGAKQAQAGVLGLGVGKERWLGKPSLDLL